MRTHIDNLSGYAYTGREKEHMTRVRKIWGDDEFHRLVAVGKARGVWFTHGGNYSALSAIETLHPRDESAQTETFARFLLMRIVYRTTCEQVLKTIIPPTDPKEVTLMEAMRAAGAIPAEPTSTAEVV